jgi:MFS family permease
MDSTLQDSLIDAEMAPTHSTLPAASEGRTRGFWALIATQFQGAYSDNILRSLLLSMIVGMGLSRNERETFVSVVTFLFSVPFILLSMPGGWLADHFSKRQITIWTKGMELGSMVVATAGLATHSLHLVASGAHSRCFASSALRPIEVWPAAGTPSGQAALLGQWSH